MSIIRVLTHAINRLQVLVGLHTDGTDTRATSSLVTGRLCERIEFKLPNSNSNLYVAACTALLRHIWRVSYVECLTADQWLHSASTPVLVVSPSRRNTIDGRVFPAAGERAWSSQRHSSLTLRLWPRFFQASWRHRKTFLFPKNH